MRRLPAAIVMWMMVCSSAAAQGPAPDRPGPYVVDIRGATVSLPQDAGFFPPLPSSTAVPSRGFGIEVGGHVYFLQLGAARVGVGGTFTRVRGTASPSSGDDEEADSAVAGPAMTPEVAALLTTVSPQISVNFGSRDGWSYLSAGVGRTSIATRTSPFADADREDGIDPGLLLEHDGFSSFNLGGGARWFVKSRLAFSFDVRFHMLGSGSSEPATPGKTLIGASVGVSLR